MTAAPECAGAPPSPAPGAAVSSLLAGSAPPRRPLAGKPGPFSQPDLFGNPIAAPAARSTDPGTSHEAALSAKELAERHARIILEALRTHGPCGKDRIAALTRLTGVQVCRRLPELQRAGLIEETGKTVTSTAGRKEREWRAC